MKQSLIIPREYYKSASIGGFEYSLEKKVEIILFFNKLFGLKWRDFNNCICIDNGEITPINTEGPIKEGWTDLLLKWTI